MSETVAAPPVEAAPAGSLPAHSEASRCLCAAAYRDARFRRGVLECLRHAWYRAPAPEFGIDKDLISRHCRRAERREHLRDLLMLVAFLVGAYRPILWLLAGDGDPRSILLLFGWDLAIGLVAAGLVLFVERIITEHFTVARQFSRAAYSGPLPTERPSRTDEQQNLVVYGGYSPFVGSGHGIGGWSFSVNLERRKEEFGVAAEADPFTSRQLLTFVETRLNRLHIEGLEHYDMLFADGRLARANQTLFAGNGKPYRHIPSATIAEYEDSPQAGTRAYLCISMPDWRGEIVVTIYLRVKKGDSNLFLEASYFFLPPPRRSFFQVDEMDPRLRADTVARIFVRSVVILPFQLFVSAFSVLVWLQAPLGAWMERRRIRRSIRRNPSFNFGAITSIRQLGSEYYYRVYFQQLDKDRHVKTIEQVVIDAVVEFLAAHNVDTSDIRDRRSTILNNGVIVSGGDVRAEGLAVGAGARAVVSGDRSATAAASTGTTSPRRGLSAAH